MTSTYLSRLRPVRVVIEELIAMRVAELARTDEPEARRRVADALDRLRHELARLCPNSNQQDNARHASAAVQRALRDE